MFPRNFYKHACLGFDFIFIDLDKLFLEMELLAKKKKAQANNMTGNWIAAV